MQSFCVQPTAGRESAFQKYIGRSIGRSHTEPMKILYGRKSNSRTKRPAVVRYDFRVCTIRVPPSPVAGEKACRYAFEKSISAVANSLMSSRKARCSIQSCGISLMP